MSRVVRCLSAPSSLNYYCPELAPVASRANLGGMTLRVQACTCFLVHSEVTAYRKRALSGLDAYGLANLKVRLSRDFRSHPDGS